MQSVLRSSLSVALLGGCLILGWALVLEPYRQNQFVKFANAHQLSETFRQREALALLDLPALWDPYLEARGDLARARILRRLGRDQEALHMYRIAIEGRLPLDHWVELGLYELELGYSDDAMKRLRMAAAFRFDFRQSISDPAMRRQVRKMVGTE